MEGGIIKRTRRLIDNLCIFRKTKKNIDHYTIQILNGHGIFNVYRKTIKQKKMRSMCCLNVLDGYTIAPH